MFIVDIGVIRLILYYPQRSGRNMDEIIRALKKPYHQTTSSTRWPCRNWPNNVNLQAIKVIIPPASTMQEAQARLEDAKAE